MIIKTIDAKLLQALSDCQKRNTPIEVKVCNEIGEVGSIKGKISKKFVTNLFDKLGLSIQYENEPNVETTICFFLKDAKVTGNFVALGIKNCETGEVIFENQNAILSLRLDPQLIGSEKLETIKRVEKGDKLLKNIGSFTTIQKEGKGEIKGMLRSVELGGDDNIYVSVSINSNVVARVRVDDKTNLSFKKCVANKDYERADDEMLLKL